MTIVLWAVTSVTVCVSCGNIVHFIHLYACFDQAPHRADGKKALSKAASAQVLGLGTTYPSRSRKSSVPIHRPHHWGFKSLRPPAPLKTQHLIALREVCVYVCMKAYTERSF